MVQGKLTDPADKVKKEKEDQEIEDKMRVLDIAEFSISDFKPIPKATAQSVHPFEGYPIKPKIKIGEGQISTTYIVGLNPHFYVHQDPSGSNLSISDGKRGRPKIRTIQTVHSRIVTDHEEGKNTDIVFAHTLKLKDGEIRAAVVYSHSARAQICFLTNPETGKMDVDTRYSLLDGDQKNLLRKMYIMIHSPQANTERLSRAITGESEEVLEEIP